MAIKDKLKLCKDLPATPGVYLMKGQRGKVLYIGKAGNLRRRVRSYYLRANDSKTERLLAEIGRIDYQKTDTAIEALILESQLIKKSQIVFHRQNEYLGRAQTLAVFYQILYQQFFVRWCGYQQLVFRATENC